ncbi:hypothetical protein Bca52824_016828 [Brassica carinata]|uniref:Uncharacterized protein n=1 Tax=Brassica carinata TaxID=52824 RepID=A0A8X7W759_BRACI|nr:hypothetical protein Bca52824_016828 [Brassica carinata]
MVAPRDVDVVIQSGCRINIYVNSNVQGTCGSALFGSKVKLRDPGGKEMRLIKVGLGVVCLFNVFLGLVLLLSSWLRKETD